jgi:hypothetical protein
VADSLPATREKTLKKMREGGRTDAFFRPFAMFSVFRGQISWSADAKPKTQNPKLESTQPLDGGPGMGFFSRALVNMKMLSLVSGRVL